MIRFYIFCCVIGTILPYTAFISWVMDNGLNISAFTQSIIASKVGLFAWLDVLVSGVVLIVYVIYTGSRDTIPYWWTSIIATLTVGVSLGLPLYLLLREIKAQQVSDIDT